MSKLSAIVADPLNELFGWNQVARSRRRTEAGRESTLLMGIKGGELAEASLVGKTVVVTGSTSGIGLAAAERLARRGASVIGVGRSEARCREAEQRLRAINPEARPVYLVADLSLQSQVRRLAAQVREMLAARGQAGLDGLINNAGTFTYWFTLTAEGFETQWAVNHLAPFLLTHELLPLLQAASRGDAGRGGAGRARVVTTSSDSHYGMKINWDDVQLSRHYNGLWAYGQSKLANVLFTQELNRRLGAGSSVRAFAADPGLVKTDIGLKGTPGPVRWVWELRRSGGVSAEESARGLVFLVGEPSIQESVDLYWKDGSPKHASRAAMNREAAARLWTLSEKMCGIETEN